MTYTPDYTGADLASIFIDFIGNLGVVGIDFAPLIAVVLILGWLYFQVS